MFSNDDPLYENNLKISTGEQDPYNFQERGVRINKEVSEDEVSKMFEGSFKSFLF